MKNHAAWLLTIIPSSEESIWKLLFAERHFSEDEQKLDFDESRMTEEAAKKHTGKCYDCGGPLELFELNLNKATKIMLCQNCGLYHFYKKDFIGNYKLTKVSKNPVVSE